MIPELFRLTKSISRTLGFFQDDAWPDWFARLRRDDSVHFTADGPFGPYWPVTRPQAFLPASGITLFIAMDPPKHDVQRLVMAPIVAPGNLSNMAGIIRERAGPILDSLPRNEMFDRVELERRRDMIYGSNIAMTKLKDPNALVTTEEERPTGRRSRTPIVSLLTEHACVGICRLVSGFIVAWANGWRSCN